MAAELNDIRRILADARAELQSKPNVVATGVGFKMTNGKKTGELALICSVDRKKAKKNLSENDLIPSSIQNIPTDVFPSGGFYALQDPTQRYRPAPGGVSIGHIFITAGTLGCLVQKNGKKFILSNNHVLANSNDADIGDAIVQPGPTDGGDYPEDWIAKLSEFIPIHFENGNGGSTCPFANAAASALNGIAAMIGSKTRLKPQRSMAQAEENKVDCAIAEPNDPNDVNKEIMQIGTIQGVVEGALGMEVKKSGRTTSLTQGTIEQIDVTVQVSYGSNKVATFVDQLMTGNMSAGGDSGSVVLDMDNKICGLLFAGSSSSTILSRIQNVFDALQVTYV